MSEITMTARIRRSNDQVWCDLAGEVVILGMREGFYYGLDGVAARIWSLLDEEVDVCALHARIVAEFEVSEARFRADLVPFLDELRSRGLIDVVTAERDNYERQP